MKRGSYIKFAFVLVFSIIISACTLQKDVNVKSIEIVEETVPEFIVVGEFDEAGIKALITYDDGTTEKIDVNSNLLKDAYQECLNSAGEYEVEILFKGESTKFNIKMVDVEKIHVVRFYNGLNELVSMQFVEDGKDAVAPSGQSHLIEGYDFIGWDRTFTNVTKDINVYAIYSKVDEIESEGINYHSLLVGALDNMRSNDLNILDVWELSSKRIETTLYYKNLNLDKVVKKVTEANREVNYNKYFKDTTSSEVISYVYEKYDSSGFYSKVAITADEFSQYEVYGFVKKIISSTDVIRYSTYHSLDKEFYKLVAVVPNVGDGGYDSDEYEFLFSKDQIISLKHFLVEESSVGTLVKTLTSTKYYTINLEEDEKIVFPSDINLGNIVEDVFNHDVVITIEEMRDILVVAQVTENDADNKAALIIRDEVETYMWDKEQATYYTKEEFGLNNSTVQVYKTISSSERYGTYYYCEWKELSNATQSTIMNEDSSITFLFRVEETSSMRAHNVEFTVLNNKLVRFEKYYYNANELIYIERATFSYEDVEVNIQSALINGEANAIQE